MFLPYRVKNPPKRFPFTTLSLIALNLLVWTMTSQAFLVVREEIVNEYAFILWKTPAFTFFTASFLHGDIFHILGNMWFLWIFGPAVEDRLGVPKFLGVYLATGLVGFAAQALLDVAFTGLNNPIIGASACIMGIAGAYLWAFPWSTICVFYFIWFFIKIWYGVFEVAALWVVGGYLLLDLWSGLRDGALHAGGGVASFAHVGAGVAGLIIAWAMGVKRDTEALSEAKAVQADAKDLHNMPFHALENMIEADPTDLDVLRASIGPSIRQGKPYIVSEAIAKLGPGLIMTDYILAYSYLMDLHGDPGVYQSVHLLKLAGQFERAGEFDKAINVYKLIADTRQQEMEAENALYRMAYCYWTGYQHKEFAGQCLAQLQKRYPRGQMMPFAVSLWKQIQAATSGQSPTGA